jgi:hypothetical protein
VSPAVAPRARRPLRLAAALAAAALALTACTAPATSGAPEGAGAASASGPEPTGTGGPGAGTTARGSTPAGPAATGTAAAAATLLAVGDMASCSSSGDEATAALAARLPGTLAAAGDLAYPDGSARNFAECYQPGWGRLKARTRPAPGNHEYHTPGAAAYFAYFGPAAGTPGRGWYSYDLGAWHIVALNSNCGEVGGCGAGSPQLAWLTADLARSRARCTLAYWHHPLFTSGGEHSDDPEVRPLYQALYAAGADLVITGHNHNYERFAPQDAAGRRDTARGVREFVVGTGGGSHYAFPGVHAGSEVRNGDTYGVLRLTLTPSGYAWRFVPVPGRTFTDSGSGTCH